jgi:hypothetical protein
VSNIINPLTQRLDSITGNIYKVAFWVVAYLIHNPILLKEIKAELAPAISAAGELVDAQHLNDKCPQLDAVYNEVLRLVLASALMRDVVAPTVVGGKVLRTGMKLMVSLRLHISAHTNERKCSLMVPSSCLFLAIICSATEDPLNANGLPISRFPTASYTIQQAHGARMSICLSPNVF